ncbi:macrophage mannose receptor 1-like [Megalobrama amblycephala]|uniref:macrophage mannose receptor 1-like n=1 Tax=Megalobrama amblycephala TaxID=75352 RepID=UPI002013D183|nr:macrophage mannose receptor 1-like [Megalobrama amblycephala]
MALNTLFSSSRLLSLTLCKPHEYVLIQELVTWEKAQDYCRKNHIDLATVQSDEDWTNLREVAVEKGFYGFAWIGLYDDINSWRWSYQDESLEFKSWFPGQPDNYGTGEECVTIFSDQYWKDYKCDNTRYFVCSDESANATENIILIKKEKTWLDAQKYCREHHTDLVTIRRQADNSKVASLTNLIYEPWIGLYRDSWKWSDQAIFTSSTELAVQRLNLMNEDCAPANYYRTIEDDYCTALHYFYCSTVKKKQQVIRVQVKASENADDATLSALVLRKLQQTLGDQDVTLTWKKQPNGKVFQKKKTVGKSSNANTPVCSRSSM